jgi:hypothetical protein
VESTTPVGTWNETVTVTDAVGAIGTTTMTVVVDSAIAISGGSNITTTQGTPRSSNRFVATLGTGPLVYSIAPADSQALPGGISIDQTGVVTSDSSVVAGVYPETITVTDSVGATTSVLMTVLVNGPLVISGGQVYMFTTHGLLETSTAFTKAGGTTPWTFTISPSVNGITIDSQTGIITVAAITAKGDYFETVTVTDSVNATSSAQIEINVNDSITVSAGVSTIHTTHGIAMYGGAAFTAVGGTKTSNGRDATGTLVFSLNPVVAGISIDSVSGIVYVDSSTAAGVYAELVTAKDGLNQIGTKLLTVTVETSVAISAGSNITTTHGVALTSANYTVLYGINTTNGGTNYSYAITDTPTYFSVVSTSASTFKVRVDSSTPAGTYYETVTATDSVGDTATVSLTILVNPIITLGQFPDIYTTRGRADSTTVMSASGGTNPITYKFQTNPSDTGITIDTNTGKVSVAATVAANTYILTIIATDSVGATASETMTVYERPVITFTTGSDIVTTQGIARQSTAFTATGGTQLTASQSGPLVYGFATSSGDAGITIDTSTGIVYVSSSVQSVSNNLPKVFHETITATDLLGVKGYAYETITVNPVVQYIGGSNITTTTGVQMWTSTFTSESGTTTNYNSGGTTGYSYTITGTGDASKFRVDTSSATQWRLRADTTTLPGTYYETVTIQDSVGATVNVPITVLINPAIVLSGATNILTTYNRPETGTAITVQSGTGTGTVTYALTSNPSDANATNYIVIDTATGRVRVLAGLLNRIYNETITGTDSVGAKATITFVIRVNDSITVSGAAPLVTTHGIGLVQSTVSATGGTTAATGGVGALKYSIISNPTSSYITIDTNTGVITIDSNVAANGTSAQIYYETIIATDSLSVQGFTYETITVNPSVTITGGSNIVTTQGIARSSARFYGNYGTGTIHFTVAVAPTPTAGTISITDTTGVLSATNNVPAGTYYETITATDAVGDTAVVYDSIVVNQVITLSQLSDIYTTQGRADSTTIITSSGGTSPITYSFSVSPSASGISVDTNTGRVSVTAAQTYGTFIVTITATDTVTATKSETMTVHVNQPVAISGGSNIVTTQSIARSSLGYTGSYGTLFNNSGSGNYVFSLVSNPTNSGITIDSSTGIITVSSSVNSASSNLPQVFHETVTVSDIESQTASIAETITVNPVVQYIGGATGETTTQGVQMYTPYFTSESGTTTNYNSGGTIGYRYSFTGTGTSSYFSIDSSTNTTWRFRVDTNTPYGTYYETVTIQDSVGAIALVPITVLVNQPIALSGATNIVTTFNRTDSASVITAQYGTGSITFTLVSTPSDTNISINANTGKVTAAAGTAVGVHYETITATDSVGATAKIYETITVNPSVVVSNGGNILTTVGIPATTSAFTSDTSTGTGVKTFTVTTLQGLAIGSTTGIVTTDSTTPVGVWLETVTATDTLGMQGFKTFTVTIDSAIVVSAGSNITTTQGVTRSSSAFQSQYGTGTRTFSIARSNGSQPSGITINSSGVVTADSTTPYGTYIETVTATDTVNATGYAMMTILVNPPITLTETATTIYTTFGNGIVWNSTTASGGTSPITYALTASAASVGHVTINTNTGALTFDSTLPSGNHAPLSYVETVTASDSVNATAVETMTIVVNPAIYFSGGSNLITTSGISLTTATLTPSGGTGTLTMSLSGTANSSYITFDTPTGRITTATNLPVGVYYETITATDTLTMKGYFYETITVDSLPVIAASSGLFTVNSTFDTGTIVTYTFTQGTGPLNSKVTGTINPGITWDTSTAGTAKLTIQQFMPITTLYETITVTDSVGATTTQPLTLNFLKGNRLQIDTAVLTNIRYGDTTTASVVGYPNGNACATSSYFSGGYTVVKFTNTGTCNWAVPAGVSNVDVLAVGGGAGGAGVLPNSATPIVNYTSGLMTSTTQLTDAQSIVNSSLVGAPSVSGGVVSFSGSQYSLMPTDLHASLDTTSALTLLVTVNPTASGVIVDELGTAATSSGWHDTVIEAYDDGTTKNFYFSLWGCGTIKSSVSISWGSWYTVALSYDGTTITTFVNGVAAGSEACTRSTPWSDPAHYGMYYELALGDATHMKTGANGNFQLSHFAIYNYGLSQTQVQNANGFSYGAGGGGDVQVMSGTSVTPNSLLSIKVGAGGTYGCSNACGSTVSAGDSTTITGLGSFVIAYGGSYATTTSGGASGATGVGGTSYSTGTGGSGVSSPANPGSCNVGTAGSNGTVSTITGSSVTYGDGGGGGIWVEGVAAPSCGGLAGGSGNGGTGASHTANSNAGSTAGGNAVANTGSGGGAAMIGNDGNPPSLGTTANTHGGNGSAGIVVIRFATPAPYTSPLVDGNLTYATTSSSVCSVDTNTGVVTANGSIGNCVIQTNISAGTYYNASTAYETLTIRPADTITVTQYVSPNTYNFTNAALVGITETYTITGLVNGDTITGVSTPVTPLHSAGSTCATGGTCALGATGPGGGIVFYDAGSTQPWGRYLEAAPANWNTSDTGTMYQWCSVNNISESSTLNGLGDGIINTTLASAGCSSGAIKQADNYANNGFTDWYVPTTAELTQMYAQKITLGLDATAHYWSSTESGTSSVYTLNPNGGSVASVDTKGATNVALRPIRAFDVNTLAASKQIPINAGIYTVTPSALTLASARPLSNYAAVQYVAASSGLRVKKINQDTVTIPSGLVGVVNQNTYLTANGGNSTKQTIFKLVGGGSASNCSISTTAYGTTISATSVGTCLLYAVKPADNNYYPAVSAVASISFESFTIRVQATPSPAGRVQIIQGPTPVDTSSIPAPSTKLTITGFTPTSGTQGTVMYVYGTGFQIPNYTVSFVLVGDFGDRITPTVDSSTQIHFPISAASTSGPITIYMTNDVTIMSLDEFTFVPPVASGETITSFSPSTGVPGTSVVITGTGFTGATKVTIGGNNVASFTVNSSTQITAITSSGNSTGVIAVTAPGGTVNSATNFIAAVEPPRITLTNSSFTIDSQTAATTANTYSINSIGGSIVSYSLTGTLPAGMSFSSSTGLLSGTPTEVIPATTYTVTAISGAGTGSATFTLTTS